MKKTLFLLSFMVIVFSVSAQNRYRQQIDLQGKWQFALDPDSTGISRNYPISTFNEEVILPGTTDTNKKGIPLTNKEETTHLSRLFSYFGKAWYKKDIVIPASFKGKDIILYLERTKPTIVFVDGKKIGHNDDITIAQTYNLTNYMKPGKHTLAVMVDNGNSVPKQLLSNSHAYTEDTQTNWNGIIGKMYVEAISKHHITNLVVIPSASDGSVAVSFNIDGNIKKNRHISLSVLDLNGKSAIKPIEVKWLANKNSENEFKTKFTVTDPQLWSEFHPSLYQLNVEIDGADSISSTFGFCDFKANGHHFYVNGHETFLRGKHDACVFPLTAHTAMDVDSWRKYFQIAKQYGINHYRFHSWCPPEACFEAADIEGVYLQPELPFWGDFNKSDNYLMSFLKKEGMNMIKAYRNHPSFVMMALGNELWGDIPMMKSFVDSFRTIDNKILYTFGSNFYLGYKGYKEGMDYFTTCRVGGEKYGEYNTHVRGSFAFSDVADGGLINHEYPNTVTNFDKAIGACPMPVISHETAQFQTYPDYNEIKKYTGVLYPYNMEVFRERLHKAGMLSQAADFHKASGLWSIELYKADIEMDLRTRNMGGFHLLDLQDYPGQGSAYVGILDAFMHSKGITTPEEFRQWCSPVVPLLNAKGYTYNDGDVLDFNIQIANYTEQALQDKSMSWRITDTKGNTYDKGSFAIPNDSIGLFDAGKISSKVSARQAGRYTLSLNIDGTPYRNTYPIWFYPMQPDAKQLEKGIIITSKITDEIGKKLERGAKVLLMPDSTQFVGNTVGGLFQTDYWNYRMFKTISNNNKRPVSPGTLGILTDPTHPIFVDFPTEMHTNWQWFPIIKQSHPLILDGLNADYKPIVQVIDNIERNHRLGLIFEFSVGKGKLLVCMSGLSMKSEYKETRQLYESILNYMHSDKFNPGYNVTLRSLLNSLTNRANSEKINELKNISYE